MSHFARHFFVCVNQRPPGGKPSCGAQGAPELIERLQEGLAQRPDLWGKIAITPSGCLGPCFDGPSMVVYPEGVWYGRVAPEDVPELIEQHMAGGRPVERLIYHWPAS